MGSRRVLARSHLLPRASKIRAGDVGALLGRALWRTVRKFRQFSENWGEFWEAVKVRQYKPRDYILENLTREMRRRLCSDRSWTDLIFDARLACETSRPGSLQNTNLGP